MKGSEIAKSGYDAEDKFRTDPKIKQELENFFKKKINMMAKVHGEKYDTIVTFEDKTIVKIQNKNSKTFGGRGGSFDRRHVSKTFSNQFIRKYLVLLSLIRNNKKETAMTSEQKQDFIKLCNQYIDEIKEYLENALLGAKNNQNEYWCFMHEKKLCIISSKTLLEYVLNNIMIKISPRKEGTCLYLTEFIYLQRKGGGKADNNPNHIQAKIRITEELLQKMKTY